MSDLREANLEDIRREYFEGKDAELALHSLRRSKNRDLDWVLRDHRKVPITDPEELRLRALADELMAYCGVLEVALLSGFIESRDGPARPPDEPMWRDLNQILNDEAVRKFYESHYPLMLPQLLRQHLNHESQLLPSQEDPETIRLMLGFLALDTRFVRELKNGVLLRFMDDFVIQQHRFSDVMRALEKPVEYRERLLRPARERDNIDQALHELGSFFDFCASLQQLLNRASDRPLIQSAIWHNYAYWFDLMSDKLKGKLEGVVDRFLSWHVELTTTEDSETLRAYITELQDTLDDVMSRKYAEPIERLIVVKDHPADPPEVFA